MGSPDFWAMGGYAAFVWPAYAVTILVPLIVMLIAFTLLFLTLHLAAMRNEIMRRRVRTLLIMQADAATGL